MADKINDRGQNLSDDDLLLVSDVSTNSIKSTTLKNLYDGFLKIKVPHPSGAPGSIQFKGTSELSSSPKLKYDDRESTLKVDGKIKSLSIVANDKLICAGSVYNNIIKTSDLCYEIKDGDYTVVCDTQKNKVEVALPPPCNNQGRTLIIKKVNSDRFKLNSAPVEITCEESKIDISDSVILKSNYSARTLQSDGESWLIINKIG